MVFFISTKFATETKIMSNKKTTVIVFILLIVICGLYRVWESRPGGFAPQIAMALFAGSVIKDKRFSFLVPLLSMLVSDILYQVLYTQGLSTIKGFYSGIWANYLLFTLITVIGFFINKKNIGSIILGSVAGAVFFFITSNFLDWLGGGLDLFNQPYPKTFAGLIKCYAAGILFFKNSLWATLIFNGIFFGSYYLYSRFSVKSAQTA
jgi:hypothetical protein